MGRAPRPAGRLLSRKNTVKKSSILCLLLLLNFASPAQAQQQPAEQSDKATLSVKGVGTFYAKPDYATLRLELLTKAPALDEAAKSHQDRAAGALAALQNLGAQGIGIERSTFELQQEKRYPAVKESKLPPPAFTAKTTFFLKTTAIDDLNAVVTKLAASGLFEKLFGPFRRCRGAHGAEPGSAACDARCSRSGRGLCGRRGSEVGRDC